MTRAEELEAIRATHYAEPLAYTHAADRAFLLAEVERLREALEELRDGDFTSRGVRMIVTEALNGDAA